MTRYAPLLLATCAAAASALSADARLVDPDNNQRRRRRVADVQGLPDGASPNANDEFSEMEVERPVPGTDDLLGERAVPLEDATAAVAEAIAEATSGQAAEAEETAHACSRDRPGACAELAGFGTTLFRALLAPALEESTTSMSTSISDNTLMSPFSIGQALALVTAGATPGSTCESELLAVLGVEDHGGVPLLADAILSSAEDSDGVSLTTASSVWLHGSIKASYEERAEIIHHASAMPLPRTYGPMNEWAELVSGGQVKNLFDASQVVDPLMRAALINVVSFRGTWKHRFDPAKTEVGVFTEKIAGGDGDVEEEEKVVKYMKDRKHVLLHPSQPELGDAVVMKLDYGPVRTDPERGWERPSEFSALFVLPKDGTVESERAVLDGLAQSTSVAELIRGLRPREVNLSLPKFKLEFGTASLRSQLRSMGLAEVFDGTRVLSGMSDDPDLHLDDILHKAVMEVTEDGTTASAATAAMIMTRSVPPPPQDLEFNRPFLVMVVHVETGTPLFIGRVGDPNLSFEEDGLER